VSTSESTGVGACGRNSAASARPSAAVATAVAALALRDEAGAVGREQDLGAVVAVDRERGHADGRCHRTAQAADCGTRTLGGPPGASGIGARSRNANSSPP
jgi:hypothetical protein